MTGTPGGQRSEAGLVEAASGPVVDDESSVEIIDDLVVETTAEPAGEELFHETLQWLADAALVVHTVEEARVVPNAPCSEDMWDLGKLCSERMGLYQKVNRLGRSRGRPLAGRERDLTRHFMLGRQRAKSWEDVLVLEAVVGPAYRLFFESFLRCSDAALAALAKDLWHQSQVFIRFGQVRLARAIGSGDIRSGGETALESFQSAVDTWLPHALGMLTEVPSDLDKRWVATGYREKRSSEITSDYADEIATYLNACELEIPASCRDELEVPEVQWVGARFASSHGPRDGLKPAVFAFSKRETMVGRPRRDGSTDDPRSSSEG